MAGHHLVTSRSHQQMSHTYTDADILRFPSPVKFFLARRRYRHFFAFNPSVSCRAHAARPRDREYFWQRQARHSTHYTPVILPGSSSVFTRKTDRSHGSENLPFRFSKSEADFACRPAGRLVRLSAQRTAVAAEPISWEVALLFINKDDCWGTSARGDPHQWSVALSRFFFSSVSTGCRRCTALPSFRYDRQIHPSIYLLLLLPVRPRCPSVVVHRPWNLFIN